MQEQAEKQHPPSSDEKEAGSDTPPAGHDTPLASHDPTPAGPPRQLSGALWAICVASILVALFLFALDNTIVALVQPAIVHSLGHIEKLAWLSVSFALGSVATNLLWGKLYGQFNGRKLFIAAVLLFEIGSAICGAAPTMDAFIVGRTICGAGGSGIYMGAMNLLSVSTTTTERPLYLSFTGFTWGTGTVLGPIVGGAFADSSATWRWAFYINLCVGAVVAPAFFFLLPSHSPRPGVPRSERLKGIDYVGAILVAGATVSGVMAISFGGALYPWNSGQTIGCFVASGVLWIALGIQQGLPLLATTETRLFPFEMIKDWELDIFFAQTAASIACAFIPIYFIPLYFQFVRNDTALQAGVRLLPFVFLMVFSTIMNGAFMAKLQIYMPWYFLGGILVVVGAALMYTIDVDSTAAQVYGYGIILGIGAGAYSQASFSVAQAKVARERVAEVTAFIGFGQMMGITLALSIAASVFINRATLGIAELVPDAPIGAVQAAIQGVGSSFFESLDDGQRRQILDVVVSSMGDAYILCMAGGALSVVLSLFMKRERLFMEEAVAGGA